MGIPREVHEPDVVYVYVLQEIRYGDVLTVGVYGSLGKAMAKATWKTHKWVYEPGDRFLEPRWEARPSSDSICAPSQMTIEKFPLEGERPRKGDEILEMAADEWVRDGGTP